MMSGGSRWSDVWRESCLEGVGGMMSGGSQWSDVWRESVE